MQWSGCILNGLTIYSLINFCAFFLTASPPDLESVFFCVCFCAFSCTDNKQQKCLHGGKFAPLAASELCVGRVGLCVCVYVRPQNGQDLAKRSFDSSIPVQQQQQ